MTSLCGKNILLIEYQPLVAADIEDRLLEAGVAKVIIISRPVQIIELNGYDALIVNATQDRNLAERVVASAGNTTCSVVVLHDDARRGREHFPQAEIVEIPFDSEAVRDALARSFVTPQGYAASTQL